ncbi:MAG: NAD(P)/FAD-dependent oxidoreductase [Tepidanaerobacteraceae bacterium]|jgi:sulfide:quinone oxidoreductase
MQKTLILGGGIGGIVASNVLKKVMGQDMQVTVVDRKPDYHFPGAFPMLMIGERNPESISRPLMGLGRKKIEFICDDIIDIDFGKKRVFTGQHILPYDNLIIALGVEYRSESVPGFNDYVLNAYEFEDVIKINKQIQSIYSGRIVFFISSLPFKCPPAPYEIVFMLDQFFRQRGLRSKVEIVMVTPEVSPEPLAGPKVGQSVRKMLAERNIELVTQAKILGVEKDALILDHGMVIKGDMFIGIAPHWTPRIIRSTNLVDGNGFIEVNPSTLETRLQNVYAIGDVTAIKLPVLGAYAPKAGIFAHYQGEVVARNIACLARGLKPKFRYTGKGSCIMYTGFGRARYSTVHYYRKPTPFITLLRPTFASYLAKVAFEKYWLNCWF